MNKFIYFFITPFMIFLSYLPTSCDGILYNDSKDRTVKKLLQKLAKRMEHQYTMNVIGTNIGMPGGVIGVLGLEFQVYRKLTKDEARKILIESTKEVLIEINANENIHGSLKNFPFTKKNIEITLYIYKPSRDSFYYPEIDTAAMNQGELKFTTTDKENTYVYKTREYESYDEALKIVENAK